MSTPNTEIPKNLPNNQQDRITLGKFWDQFSNRQWFNSANIIDNHPTQMRKTIEIRANYKPVVEMKDILTFSHEHNLALEWIVIGNQ